MSSSQHLSNFITISKHDHCVVKQNKENNQHGLFANASFKAGSTIVAFNALIKKPRAILAQGFI
jgi:hypothetical protein